MEQYEKDSFKYGIILDNKIIAKFKNREFAQDFIDYQATISDLNFELDICSEEVMHFKKGDMVRFVFDNSVLTGRVVVADKHGYLSNETDLYDIYIDDKDAIYKHVPERNILNLV